MIQVKINSVDVTNQIKWEGFRVTQILTNQVDQATFQVRKYGDKTLTPAYDDDIEIYDGTTKIFGGKIINVEDKIESGASGVFFTAKCVDHSYEMDHILVSKTYSAETIGDIIDDMVTNFAPTFTSVNAASTFVVEKIVFNNVPMSTALKRLASIVNYDWYVDEDKDIHFFPTETNSAPFGITDDNGNYLPKTYIRNEDGSQVVNRVLVRGGEYDGATKTEVINVSGDDQKVFFIGNRVSDITVELDTGGGYVSQDVGVEFDDDFTTKDVLFNFQNQSISFENALSDGDLIRWTGKPKIRVLGVSEDSASQADFGRIDKLIRDDTVKSNEVARKIASAELYAFALERVTAQFVTLTPGLRSGMLINIQSDQRGTDDDLIIKQIDFIADSPTSFRYQVKCISTKDFDLIDMLQKLMEPQPLDVDEQETSEQVFTDTQEVAIAEEITVVNPVEDEQEVAIAENNLLDPLGAGVNAIYVLAPYTPTSQTDTKRPGRLDISLELL